MQTLAQRFFSLGRAIGEGTKQSIAVIDASDEVDLAYKATQFFFFCKSYKTYQAIELLSRSGFSEDGMMLARSLFEMVAQAKYISEDPENRVKRFAEFGVVERMRLYERIKRSDDEELISKIESDPASLADLKQEFKSIRAQYEGPSWWGKSLEWLAGEVGLAGVYHTMVWEQMGLTHSSGRAMLTYMRETPAGLEVSCDPIPSELPELAVQSTWALVLVVNQLAVATGLPTETQRDEWHRRFVAIAEDAKLPMDDIQNDG